MNEPYILEVRIYDLVKAFEKIADAARQIEEAIEALRKAERVQTPASKKYRRLSDFLEKSNAEEMQLSFKEIEEILGFKLPTSAYTHRASWANTTTHSMALSWLSVGYQTVGVNIKDQAIIFNNYMRGE